MAAFDAITELPPPSRTWAAEEDDAIDVTYEPAEILWSEFGLEQRRRQEGGALRPRLLLVGDSPAAAALLPRLSEPGGQLLGTLVLKERPRVSQAAEAPRGKSFESGLYWVTGGAQEAGEPPAGALLLAAHPRLPKECCLESVRALFQCIEPQRVVAIGAMPASQFRGPPPDPEFPLFVLESDANKDGQPALKAPYLPPGSLVEGFAAGTLSHCHVRRVPAALYVAIRSSPASDVGAITALASLLAHSLSEATGMAPTALDAAARSAQSSLSAEAELRRNNVYI